MSISFPPSPRTHRRIRAALLWCAMVGLVLRSLLPMGTMAGVMADSGGTGSDGRFTVVICSSAGLERITLDASGQPVADPDGKAPAHHGSDHDCPCVTGCGSPTFVLPAPVILATVDVPVLATQNEWPITAAPPLPARGPPLGSRAPPPALG